MRLVLELEEDDVAALVNLVCGDARQDFRQPMVLQGEVRRGCSSARPRPA